MGIRSKFDGDFKAIDLASMADDMLAQVVADHAADRFRTSNQANMAVAGTAIPFSVSANGRVLHRGAGGLFPRQQLQNAINPPGRTASRASRKLPVVAIDWAWENLQGSALDRALTNLVRINKQIERIEDPLQFARKVLQAVDSPTAFLIRSLLTRYAKTQYPALFKAMGEAKALYRVYRIVSAGGRLLAGDKDQQADQSVLAWIAQELRSRSPVLSGEYRDAHALYGDGRMLMLASAVTDDMAVPHGDEYSFTNTVPYSRKIEFGKTRDGRAFVVSVEPHIYERVAQEAARRFRGVAEIFYEVRAVIDAHQTPQRHAWRPHNRPGVRYPAIVVRF